MKSTTERNRMKSTQSTYTKKITTPVYEPKNKMPNISELYDTAKRDSLVQEILEQNLPDEIQRFLISAAERHTVFKFSKVADFYAHAPRNIKELMENSALVIIDYDKAIENGFTTFNDAVQGDLREYLDSKW